MNAPTSPAFRAYTPEDVERIIRGLELAKEQLTRVIGALVDQSGGELRVDEIHLAAQQPPVLLDVSNDELAKQIVFRKRAPDPDKPDIVEFSRQYEQNNLIIQGGGSGTKKRVA